MMFRIRPMCDDDDDDDDVKHMNSQYLIIVIKHLAYMRSQIKVQETFLFQESYQMKCRKFRGKNHHMSYTNQVSKA